MVVFGFSSEPASRHISYLSRQRKLIRLKSANHWLSMKSGLVLSMWTFLLKKALLGDISLEEESFETAEVSARKRRRMSACLGMFR